jgi:hypothetical protein
MSGTLIQIRTDDVVWQELDGEFVLLDLRRSVYLATNVAGSSLAKLLTEPTRRTG